MTLLLLLAALHTVIPAAPQYGYAARYRPGLHAQAARNHGLTPAPCMIARLTRADLGKWFVVESRVHGRRLVCKSVDYTHPRDRRSVAARWIIAELDPKSNRTLCGSVRNHPRECPVRVWRVR